MIKPTVVDEKTIQAIENNQFHKIIGKASDEALTPLFKEMLRLFLVSAFVESERRKKNTRHKINLHQKNKYALKETSKVAIPLSLWNSTFRLLLAECFTKSECVFKNLTFDTIEKRIDAFISMIPEELNLNGEFFRGELNRRSRRRKALNNMGIGFLTTNEKGEIQISPKAFVYEYNLKIRPFIQNGMESMLGNEMPILKQGIQKDFIGIDLFSEFEESNEANAHKAFYLRKESEIGADPKDWPEVQNLISVSGKYSYLTSILDFWTSTQFAEWALDSENLALKKTHGPH